MEPSTAAQHTTAWLLDRARGGDDAARAALVARLEPLLRRFARGRVPLLLRAEGDTGDLVQATWLRVLGRLDAIEASHPGAFFAYLRQALINGLREGLRRHARSRVAPGADPEAALDDLAAAASVAPDDWLAWEQSLARLPAEHRGLVLMRFEFGMSFAEIATELGETPDGVRMKLNRAIARMAQASRDGPTD